MVIPKTHRPGCVVEMEPRERVALHLAARRVARMLDQAFEEVVRTGIVYEGYGVDHAKLFSRAPHRREPGWRTGAKFRRSSVPVVEERLTEAFGPPILDVARQDLRPGCGIERAVQFGRGQHLKP